MIIFGKPIIIIMEKEIPCEGVEIKTHVSCDNNVFLIEKKAQYAKRGVKEMGKGRIIDLILTELRMMKEAKKC